MGGHPLHWGPDLLYRSMEPDMQVLLDKKEIDRLMSELAERVAQSVRRESSLALVGIRSRGEILAQRMHELLEKELNRPIDLGVLDITLYRDDLNQKKDGQPMVRTTEIDFDVDGKLIILVDDVLNTGRSVRAALDALVDLGRPKAIRLAVLLDRGMREFPIAADYIGRKVEAPEDKKIQVYLQDVDGKEEVVLV